MSGLVKVGGLIAILRIAFFLQIFNRHIFEGKLQDQINKDDEDRRNSHTVADTESVIV